MLKGVVRLDLPCKPLDRFGGAAVFEGDERFPAGLGSDEPESDEAARVEGLRDSVDGLDLEHVEALQLDLLHGRRQHEKTRPRTYSSVPQRN